MECFFPLKGADPLPSYSVAQLGNWSVKLEVACTAVSSIFEPTNQDLLINVTVKEVLPF